jgi:phosphoribosylformylglycinamidine synthase
VAPERKESFEKVFSGMKLGKIGMVTELPRLSFKTDNGDSIIEEDVMTLKDAWKKRFEGLI